MKKFTPCFSAFLFLAVMVNAQTTPPSANTTVPFLSNEMKLAVISDTIDFTPYPTSTIINTQYAYDGAIFTGFNGSGDPEVYDYGTSAYGRILKSDTWYNPLRLNFVDSANTTQYVPVQHIEFDNPVNSEVDYISVDVYDSTGVIIYHYLSTSPEHVVINLSSSDAAYMTFDDSANTAYVIDNIYFYTGTTSVKPVTSTIGNVIVSPNPAGDELFLSLTASKTKQASYNITDLLGQCVLSYREFNPGVSSTEKIDLRNIQPGIYFLNVLVDGERIVKKLVKE